MTFAPMARLVAGSAIAATLLAGCATTESVSGVVVSVDSSGLADVRGFQLRADDGAILEITVSEPLENAAEFPLGHLGEHVATAEPVRVTFRHSGELLVARRIEDRP